MAEPSSHTGRRPGLMDICIFFLLFSGPPKFRAREATASITGEIDLVVMVHIVVWLLGASWILLRYVPVVLRLERGAKLRWPAILGLWVVGTLGISIFLSPSIPLSAFMVFQLATMCLFCVVFVHRFGPEVALRFIFWGNVAMTAVIAVLWQVVPDYVTSFGRLFGTLITPVAIVVSLSLIQLLSGYPRVSRKLFVAIFALCIIVVIAAQTRTTYVAIASVLCLGWLFRPNAPVRSTFLYVLGVLGVVAVAGSIEVLGEFIVRDQETVATMSQRLPLWEFLLSYMWDESPIFGLGFYAASRVLGPLFNSNLGTAHSSFVEILIGGGIAAGSAYLLLWISLGVCGLKLLLRPNPEPVHFAVCALALALFIFALTGVGIVLAGPGGFTFWMIVVMLPYLAAGVGRRPVRKAARKPPPAVRPGAVPVASGSKRRTGIITDP